MKLSNILKKTSLILVILSLIAILFVWYYSIWNVYTILMQNILKTSFLTLFIFLFVWAFSSMATDDNYK